ncbi:ABC transporter permease [Haloechinothrix sp. LS1_15]|uniref:ABC transporter permease n=1 Tax=Haloechinothrix sp. LS1_15 TaxID=2652248 RepID=UPI002944A866|nr:ABC transporter permease [Haloechinothrix sp. LS1_15]MDV6010933.1 ABC transporter permease [Haloechinothrix sp. LS1_15]
MNPKAHAARTGLTRGLIEFRQMLTNASDMSFMLIMPGILLVVLYFQRNSEVEGTPLSLAVLSIPGVLGIMVAYLAMMSPAYSLAAEREDGTLLRMKALPHGMTGYVSGRVLGSVLESLVPMVLLLVPTLLLFDGVMSGGPTGWLLLPPMVLLGLLSSLPIGFIIGSLARNPRTIGGWGFLTTGGLAAISGIFFPIIMLPAWLQVLAQIFPVYWIGLGMRSIFLPDEAAAVEIGESWRTLEMLGVLGVWSIIGLALAPVVLRRMARHESGSAVEARRHEAAQRI